MSEATTPAPDAAPAAAPTSMLDGGAGGAPSDWRSALPEDLRGAPAIKDYGDLAALVKSHINVQSLVGADKADVFRIPKSGEIPGDVWARLGRPDSAEGYGLKSETIPGEVLGEFAKTAHEAGLTKAQTERVFGYYTAALEAQAQAVQQRQDAMRGETEATLKREWGEAFDAKMHAMRRGVEQAGGSDLVAEFQKAGLANDPRVVKLFVQLGELTSEGGLRGGANAGGQSMFGPMTPAAAQAQLQHKAADPAWWQAVMNTGAPNHAAALAEYRELNRLATAGSAAA